MELTVDFESGIVEQIQREPLFANALLTEVDEVLTTNDHGPAQGMLRALVAGTTGFESLAKSLSMTEQALRTLLSQDCFTDAASLKTIAKALKLALGVTAS